MTRGDGVLEKNGLIDSRGLLRRWPGSDRPARFASEMMTKFGIGEATTLASAGAGGLHGGERQNKETSVIAALRPINLFSLSRLALPTLYTVCVPFSLPLARRVSARSRDLPV